jgi:hypothetical protein
MSLFFKKKFFGKAKIFPLFSKKNPPTAEKVKKRAKHKREKG